MHTFIHLSVLLLSALLAGVVTAAPSASASAAAWPSKPTAGASIGGWAYLGCATEVDGRALRGASYSDPAGMTVESCMGFCSSRNFGLAGLEYMHECFCDNRIQQGSGFVADGDKGGKCDMACAGAPAETCGGGNRISLFNNTAYRKPKAPAAVEKWSYVSCYMEPQGTRALVGAELYANDSMTTEMCTSRCSGAGFAYAGLEYGRECWCGTAMQPDLQDASDPNCAMQCDMTCAGNDKQICGGQGTINIYRTGTGGPAVAAAAAAGMGGMKEKREVRETRKAADKDGASGRFTATGAAETEPRGTGTLTASGKTTKHAQDHVDGLFGKAGRFIKVRKDKVRQR